MNPATPIIIAATLMGQPITITITTKTNTGITINSHVKVDDKPAQNSSVSGS